MDRFGSILAWSISGIRSDGSQWHCPAAVRFDRLSLKQPVSLLGIARTMSGPEQGPGWVGRIGSLKQPIL
jgi:hypothetical protein